MWMHDVAVHPCLPVIIVMKCCSNLYALTYVATRLSMTAHAYDHSKANQKLQTLARSGQRM